MESRREYKDKDSTEYQKTHKLITKEIRKAKEAYLAERCSEIEQYVKKYDYHNMHGKIRELTSRKTNKQQILTLIYRDGHLTTETEKLITIWEEKLFEDTRLETQNRPINHGK